MKKGFTPTKGLLKFIYEIHHRKKDFLNLCVKVDKDVTSTLTRKDFEQVLEKFTCYLSSENKNDLIRQVINNNSYINYLNICDLRFKEEIVYEHPLLIHLNKLHNEHNKHDTTKTKQNLQPHVTDISKNQNVHIHPIDLLNFEMNEQNFLIRIFKDIFDYILKNNLKDKTVESFLNQIYDQHDLDNDTKYSIGELNHLLTHCGINLGMYELRFLYESFSLVAGKILKKDFFESFFELNQKSEHVGETSDFKKGAFTNQEIKEFEQLKEILDKNEFIKIINDSVRVFGKKYLIQYYNRYINNGKNGKATIDISWLEIGYRKLGYEVINNVDIGQFKFFCVKNKFSIF